MSTPDSTDHPARCLKCRRILRRPSVDGYGPKCRAKIRRTARVSPPAAYQPWQIAKAVELLEQGALVPIRQNRIFLVVSENGSKVHRTAATGQCNCPAGLRSVRCYHAAAAQLVHAA